MRRRTVQPEIWSVVSVLRSPAMQPFDRGKTKSANFTKNGNCFLISHHHKPALGTLLYFFVFQERYSEYLGTEPTPSFLPSLMICHRLVSFGYVFSLTIDLLGRETPCKKHKLVLSLTVTALLSVYHWGLSTVCSEYFHLPGKEKCKTHRQFQRY